MNDIEQEIIRKFVRKNKQKRLIWELTKEDKREKFFWHFSGSDIFKQQCLQKVKYMSKEEMRQCLIDLGGCKRVYYIGGTCIGEMTLEQATELAENGAICVIYCGNGIAYYQGEEDFGGRPRYLLMEK